MSIVKRVASIVLLVGCLLGTGYVVWETAWRGVQAPTSTDVIETTSTTARNAAPPVDQFPIAATKNPFGALVQLPATATTQPKT